MGTHKLTIAKPSKDDIFGIREFLMALETIADSNFKLSDWEDDKDIYEVLKSMTDVNDKPDLENILYEFIEKYAFKWRRVVIGCDILVDNMCDPNEDHIAFHPKFNEPLTLMEEMDAYLSENTQNTIGNGSKFHQSMKELIKEEEPENNEK